MTLIDRNGMSGGYPLENPAKPEAQGGRHALLRKIGQCNMPMCNIPLTLISYYARPRPLPACASVAKP